MSESQHEQVRAWLLAGNSISPIEALHKFHSFRLSAIISRLKEEGMNIRTELVPHGSSRYARYHLVKEEEFKLTGE